MTNDCGGLAYADFLYRKSQLGSGDGFEPLWIPDSMFGFQKKLADWAIRQGRAGTFADCGLGKTLLQLVFAENVARHTGGRVLLSAVLFHPDELVHAQRRCIEREKEFEETLFGEARTPSDTPDAKWGADYFMAAWMGRGGHAGKGTEFGQGLALRYTSSGGDSAKRFQSAIESLDAWALALRKWSFDCCSAFDLLEDVCDMPGHGLYLDPPWPELGHEYSHRFTEAQHIRLRDVLASFTNVRIVLRYGDHPLIRDLYAGDAWRFLGNETRNQRNNDVSEVLIVRGGE